MMKQKTIYTLTMVAFLASASLFPTFASGIQDVGNGAFSNTNVQTNSSNTTNLTQDNNSTIANHVAAVSNTGGNAASFNTGSSVNITTGDANTVVGINNMTGSNTANVMGNSNNGMQNTAVAGNGAFSDNSVKANTENKTSVNQNNTANVMNTVRAENTTGNNGANFNTGSDVTVQSGNANAFVGLTNVTGNNEANVLGGGTSGSNENTVIGGNGAFSNNNVSTSSENSKNVTQSDIAHLATDVALHNSTGNNGASFNTGSTINVLSGDARSQVGITNIAGGNSANVWGGGNDSWVTTTLTGNGAFSNNSVRSTQSSRNTLIQNNLSHVANYIESMNNTGRNNTSFNTGSDVLVASGNANSWVSLFNTPSINVANLYGSGMGNNTNINVFGNGAFSNNDVHTDRNNNQSVSQMSNAHVNNSIHTGAQTGYNKTFGNTNGYFNGFLLSGLFGYNMFGNGSGSNISGDANSRVAMNNMGNANIIGSGFNMLGGF